MAQTKYICIKCKKSMGPSELMGTTRIRCIHCGYRTLRKARPEVIRKIKAR